MKAVEADWYDAILPGSWALNPLEESPALPVYEAAARLVDPELPVLDLGCGTGRFARLLGLRGVTDYLGYDFAPAVVAEARRYCPGLHFGQLDLREWVPGPEVPRRCTYVLLEVLEHLDDDLDVLARLMPGWPVVLSVPDFWSESHVRVFAGPEEVFARYGHLLDFSSWERISFPTSDNRVHVFGATRNFERR